MNLYTNPKCPKCERWPTFEKLVPEGIQKETHCFGCGKPVQKCDCKQLVGVACAVPSIEGVKQKGITLSKELKG
ncbi:MAG: hypothetical protein JNM71_12690 [Flavobacterium lindanitolerans]|uniref:hypothetical protein n=1 Tax=Flavobacterium lindanitolerans TaxID=428988 RepID=UPI001A55152A|nr:hypothetical protein [Flavobacterium lindanitolerans]MBL7868864.1 hypothetical protein [Flavobacterium lindanitolerans]